MVFGREGEDVTGLVSEGEGLERADAGEGDVCPVSEEKRQEKKDKWPRKTAICLRICSLGILQSS